MRVASTGLGKTELSAIIFDLKPEGDLLGLHATTDGPEGCKDWHIEAYIEPEDILPVVIGFLKPSVLWTLIKGYLFSSKNSEELEKI